MITSKEFKIKHGKSPNVPDPIFPLTYIKDLGCKLLTPSERVARLLGQSDSHLGHLPHPLFTEMETLVYRDVKSHMLGDSRFSGSFFCFTFLA